MKQYIPAPNCYDKNGKEILHGMTIKDVGTSRLLTVYTLNNQFRVCLKENQPTENFTNASLAIFILNNPVEIIS